MNLGTRVVVAGDRQWNGSIYRGHTGHVVAGKPGALPAGWSWVRLAPPPPCTPDRAIGFRDSTLRELA